MRERNREKKRKKEKKWNTIANKTRKRRRKIITMLCLRKDQALSGLLCARKYLIIYCSEDR